MPEEQIRAIIQDELNTLIKSDRFTFEKLIQMLDGRNIQLGKGTGTKIGTESTQKLAFWNTTPVNQPETVSDANSQGGTYSQTDVQSIADAVNNLIDRLQETGLIK